MSSRFSVLFLLLIACGSGDDGLDPASVTEIPAGGARGSAASGRYHFDSYTASCAGACGPVASGWFTYTFCDVGVRGEGDATIEQVDGDLTIDTDDSFVITRFGGGLEQDGGFEVGGYGTENGGALEYTARVEGTMREGEIDGVATFRMHGDVDDHGIDCEATYEIEGRREDDDST